MARNGYFLTIYEPLWINSTVPLTGSYPIKETHGFTVEYVFFIQRL